MDLKDIKNEIMLADFLGISKEDLFFYLKNKPIIYRGGGDSSEAELKKRWYTQIEIPKKNRKFGFRTVYKINSSKLIHINKFLQGYLRNQYTAPMGVHGFVHGKNIRSNALTHLSRKKVLKIDIKDFFESIRRTRVVKLFMQLGAKKEIAESLTQLTTLNGRVVQGFNTSPIIANMVSETMDRAIKKIADKHGCNYTRYADDITFSSDSDLPSEVSVRDLLKKFGFLLNPKKTLFMFRGEKQFVTGLTIFDDKYPRIPKKVKRKIRLRIFYARKYGLWSVAMRELGVTDADIRNHISLYTSLESYTHYIARQLKGSIDYINGIEPLCAEKLYSEFNRIKSDSPGIELYIK